MNPTAKDKQALASNGVAKQWMAAGFFQLYLSFLRLLSRLEINKATRFSRAINPLFASAVSRQRTDNFELLFPSSESKSERRHQIERNHLEYLARVRAEMAHIFLGMTPKDVRNRSSLFGLEHLEKALQRGKGVLIVEGHYGHWNCTPALLQALGHQVTAVVNPNPLQGANFRILHENASKKLGVKLAFVGQDAYSSARKVFKENGIFYLNFDVAVRSKHTKWFSFGNAAILVDMGPAIMAMRSRVPVIFARSQLTHEGTMITLSSAGDATDECSEKPTPESLMELWVNQFHDCFKVQPEQWWAVNYISLASRSVLSLQECTVSAEARTIKTN